MDPILALWYFFVFAISFFVYLSFSVITNDLLAKVTIPARHLEEPYKLPPLTRLFETEEKLIAVLQLCRLMFALPLIILLFEWVARFHVAAAIAALVVVFPILYLLPIRVNTPS